MALGRFTARPRGRRHTSGAGRLENELVGRLQALPLGPVPDPVFRFELRAQLVAIAPRVVSEEQASRTQTASQASLRPAGNTGRAGLRRIRRPLVTLVGVATVLLAILAGAVWKSTSSLPGDSLYGVKRASEDVRLSVAGGGVDKGDTYLDLAKTRADEVLKLLNHSSGGTPGARPISAHTASLIDTTLESADSSSRNGMRLLGLAAVKHAAAGDLAKLDPWLDAQRARLGDIASRVPSGPLADRVRTSLALLDRIGGRAAALRAELGCSCLSDPTTDDLGPLPCSPCTASTGVGPHATVGGSAGASTTAPNGGSGSAGPAASGQGTTGGAATSGGASATVPGGLPQASVPGSIGRSLPSGVRPPTLSVPGLPRPSLTPSLPISAGSSGVGVSVPGVSVGIGPGGISASVPLLPPVGASLP
jgi:hypothetical protein